MITKEDLDRIKLISNNVMIEVNMEDGKYYFPSGGFIYIDTSFNKAQHTSVMAKVVRVPEKFKNNKKDWLTTIEIQEGDIVWVNYFDIMAGLGTLEGADDQSLLYNGKKIIFINYRNIFVVKRGEKVFPINGFTIIEKVEQEVKSSLIIPEQFKKTKNTHYGRVVYAGKPNLAYYDDGKKIGDKTPGDELAAAIVNVGDYVIVKGKVTLEEKDYRTLEPKDKELWRVQYRDILCVLGKVDLKVSENKKPLHKVI